ncbi:MAG: excinuclease ABC subunit UvrA [Myxococcales bacterium]|nr:excinuclease ABC subunit UvrA [Myxococcales bacterium]
MRDMQFISIQGAREHNLKNVSLEFPKHKLVVFTGPSGSGKSSLAFDTLFAEGQRRYVESLSAYARQFLGQMEKPKYDHIRGLSPTISIEQKAASSNPRSTVGTITEIYDYLRLLYARAGKQFCPTCSRPVGTQSAQQIVRQILKFEDGTRIVLLSPIARNRKGEFRDILDEARKNGYARLRIDGEMLPIDPEPRLDKKKKHNIDIVIDRLTIRDGIESRLTDSVETALRQGEGRLSVLLDNQDEHLFSETLTCSYCELSLPELTPQLFSFNSPIGMCKECNGLGTVLDVDPAKIVPNDRVSLRDGAIEPWSKRVSDGEGWTYELLMGLSTQYGINLDTAFGDLPENHRNILLFGSPDRVNVAWNTKTRSGTRKIKYDGIIPAIMRRLKETRSEDMRRYYQQYLTDRPCSGCNGLRINEFARSVQFEGTHLGDLVRMPVIELASFFDTLQLEGATLAIASEVVREIDNRLRFLVHVGLGYLSLSRQGNTLSGGESQRIRLASQIGSELTGVLYILDEPSIGLHQRDNVRLIDALKHLRDIGNTVVVVEHDEEMMRSADYLVDFGPGAGRHGGEIVAHGTPSEVADHPTSLTGQYLRGAKRIEIPASRRDPAGWLLIKEASANNLVGEDISIPLGVFCCVSGVSGAGKSSLVNQILYPALARHLHRATMSVGHHGGIEGLDELDKVICIDQNPIGRTPRSNPATYTKVFDGIRDIFAQVPDSKAFGYTASRFSFNVKGGRCEACKGDGSIQIEMHFLADVFVTCEQCRGRRFNDATLKIKYKGLSISDVLDMSIDDAAEHFSNHTRIRRILQTLQDVGLGYVALGQPSPTLSGGEAQRVKLSRELARTETGRTIYILDEPSTGLHFDDVKKLLVVIDRLVAAGNSVVMIEHNMDIIKSADYVIDIGPEGGGNGGRVVAQGKPEAVALVPGSHTGFALLHTLNNSWRN